MKFIDLQQHMKSGVYKPCYFISGDDAFVVKSAVDKFRSLAGSFPELNFSIFEKGYDVNALSSTLYTPPMMADYRIVRINDLTVGVDEIEKYLDEPCSSTILLLVGEVSTALKKVMNKVEIIDCNKLDKPFICNWLKMKAKQSGASFTDDAVSLLADYCNRDMSKIFTEFQKLITYANGQQIGADVVKLLVEPDAEYKIYELSDAIAEKQSERALNVLETLLSSTESPVGLFSLLYRHFSRLLFASINPQSDTLSSDLGIKEFAVKNVLRQASKFSPKRLKKICDNLYSYDAWIKSGGFNDRNALVTFVCDTLLRG